MLEMKQQRSAVHFEWLDLQAQTAAVFTQRYHRGSRMDPLPERPSPLSGCSGDWRTNLGESERKWLY